MSHGVVKSQSHSHPARAPQCHDSAVRFAYPAEENFAGQIFPLRWAQKVASRQGKLKHWRVLLDAAKFTASHPLNLTEAQPDFVTLSFYKVDLG